MREYTELLDKLDIDLDDLYDSDEETSVELEIKAKKKERKTGSMEQLFDELINEYNETKSCGSSVFMSSIFSDEEAEKEKWADVKESICTIKLARRNYLNVEENTGERFVLLPERDGERFKSGDRVCIYTDHYKDYGFLVSDCTEDCYNENKALFEGLEIYERFALVKKIKADPDGFVLLRSLGKVKRSYEREHRVRSVAIRTRTEEFLKRIPLERDDLFNAINDTYNRLQRCSNNEKADYEEVLETKMEIASMLLTQQHIKSEPLSLEWLSARIKKAAVSAYNNSYQRDNEWTPNILVVGNNYQELLDAISKSSRSFKEISLGSVEGNDYLFGDAMSYYCSGHGELISKLVEDRDHTTVILFSDVDLMGTSVRSSNPLYGLTSLLRKHRFKDFYMKGMEIDVSKMQFICQVPKLEDCPAMLLREMDILIEYKAS